MYNRERLTPPNKDKVCCVLQWTSFEMRKLILIFCLFFTAGSIYAQIDICTCHKNYFKAEKAYYSDQSDSTFFYFQKAFSNPEFHDVAKLFNAADKLVRLGHVDYAKELLFATRKQGVSIDGIHNFVARYTKYKLTIDSVALNEVIVDTFPLDSFLVQELTFMLDRDQMIRNEYEDRFSESYKKLVDYGNFMMLKNIIERYNGALPDIRSIGSEGENSIETILLHFDIEWIAEIFPALVQAIHKGYMFNEDLLYQIERNIVDDGQIYIYDVDSGNLILGPKTQAIQKSPFHYQFYAGFDLFDSNKKRMVWWPFQPNTDKKLINTLRQKLCLDSIDDYRARRPYIREISDAEFLHLLQH